jgi:enamine deaminase RidA (YjgF/YER057c/UK114 family)
MPPVLERAKPAVNNINYPSAILMEQTLYLGCQRAAMGAPIEAQTAEVFESLVASIEAGKARMGDLINLRTYYVYDDGDGPEVTSYWNRMTEVRLRYLANPGPAATAVRVSGVPTAANLIGIDGIATFDSVRRRIMPEHAWDWTIPTPFSQGWRIGDKVYVGGQISADRKGAALATGDAGEQAKNVLDYIRHVLIDAGQGWENIVTLRIFYKHADDPGQSERRRDQILEVVRATIPEPRPAVMMVAVDLLYEGLLLEVDAVGQDAIPSQIWPPGSQDWALLAGFSPATRSGHELHIGGLCAPGKASFQAQVESTFSRLLAVLDRGSFTPGELVKLTLFFRAGPAADVDEILAMLNAYLPDARPVITVLAVPGFPHADQLFQLDGLASHGLDRTTIP